jgi:hypothetical protein
MTDDFRNCRELIREEKGKESRCVIPSSRGGFAKGLSGSSVPLRRRSCRRFSPRRSRDGFGIQIVLLSYNATRMELRLFIPSSSC